MHLHSNVQKFKCNVNSVLFDFKDIPCDVKSRLRDTLRDSLRLIWFTIV